MLKIVAIEGNIGVGKSTILEGLREEMQLWSGEDWEIIIEPVDTDPEFHRLLKEHLANHSDPDKRIVFQMYLTEQRQNMLKDLTKGNYIIERSLYSDIVFCQSYFLQTEKPSGEYLSYFYNIKERLKDYPQIDCVVYLDRDPVSCSESIVNRGRDGEHYELETLVDLKRFHDACLPQICREYGAELVHVYLGKDYALPSVIAADVMEAIYG